MTTIYAGFWRRAGARCIDVIVLQSMAVILVWLLAAGGQYWLFAEHGIFFALFYALIVTLYYACLCSSQFQATVGHQVMGIMVSTLGGDRISFRCGVARALGNWLNMLIAGSGYLMALFTEKHQALHDKIADTVVIHNRGLPSYFRRLGPLSLAMILGCLSIIALVPHVYNGIAPEKGPPVYRLQLALAVSCVYGVAAFVVILSYKTLRRALRKR
jgi:uncharacterized RDD family membrane protein YckC